MRAWLVLALIVSKATLFGGIYVCFPFYNEIEMLQIQFKELYDYVDYFVIHESCESFTGKSKPFNFQSNRERFRAYEDKIIYIQSKMRQKTDNPWVRERFQRGQLKKGLKDCADNDLILLCDCDEIVSANALQKAIPLVKSPQDVIAFEVDVYHFYLNLRAPAVWRKPRMCQYRTFKNLNLEALRRGPGHFEKRYADLGLRVQLVKKGGWHFTTMGGVEKVLEKYQAYSHSIDQKIRDIVSDYKSEFLKEFATLRLVNIDEAFPKYIRENIDSLEKKGFIFSNKQLDLIMSIEKSPL